MSKEPRKKSEWPSGTRIRFVDAWGREAAEAKVVSVKTDDFHLCADDDRGIRYYLHTDQIQCIVERKINFDALFEDVPKPVLSNSSKPAINYLDLLE